MTKLQEIYLDWANNFLTVECFARYYMIPEKDAKQLIDICRNHHIRSPLNRHGLVKHNDLVEAQR